MAVFVDWDCTITSQHMFSMLQSPKSAESSEFLQSLATEEQRRAYWAFQQRNVFHYRGWGRKDVSSLEACKAQALAPHVDLFPPQFECIKQPLREYLFGGDARFEAITRTMVQLNSHARQGLFILTKGIGSYVLAVVRSLAAHWVPLLPGLLVVDYSGHMYSLAADSEPFRGSTFPVDHKIPQMLGVFAAMQQPIPAFLLLIDDGYEGELRHVPKDAEVETKQGAVSGQGFFGGGGRSGLGRRQRQRRVGTGCWELVGRPAGFSLAAFAAIGPFSDPTVGSGRSPSFRALCCLCPSRGTVAAGRHSGSLSAVWARQKRRWVDGRRLEARGERNLALAAAVVV